MQLRVLAKEHPEIMEQVKTLENHAETLRLRRGLQLQIVQDQGDPATSGLPSAGTEGDKPT